MIPPPDIVKCRSCEAKIFWLKTKNQKPIPINASSLRDIDTQATVFDPRVHESHFATCPESKVWRKKR